MESNSLVAKVHCLICMRIKGLKWNYYLPVSWSPTSKTLIMKTSCKSQLFVLFCTILEFILIIPGLVLTPLVVKENSHNFSLVLIPCLKWICLWTSTTLIQLPTYLHRHDLSQFLEIFLTLNMSGLIEGKQA